MSPLSRNPDRDFCAGYRSDKFDHLDEWWAEPPPPLEDLLHDLAVRDRIGKLISEAIVRYK